MVLVVSYGAVYRVTDRNYKKLLEGVAAGEGYDVDRLGNNLGTYTVDLSDLTASEAQDLLEEMA